MRLPTLAGRVTTLRGCRRPRVVTRYWLQGEAVGNFGDLLNHLVLADLGCDAVAAPSPLAVNSGRCLLAIGSTVAPEYIDPVRGRIDVWGAGWRGLPLADGHLARLDVHAVRGPRSARALGVSVPMGDPALLLGLRQPHPPSAASRAGAVLMPHFLDPAPPAASEVGCDVLVSPRISLDGKARSVLRALDPIVERLQSASFVLSGSLHGCIVAAAAGVPWAPFGRGHVDCEEKWLDWAEYLGIELRFCASRADGERWWAAHGCGGRVGDLAALRAAFPYRRAVTCADPPSRFRP